MVGLAVVLEARSCNVCACDPRCRRREHQQVAKFSLASLHTDLLIPLAQEVTKRRLAFKDGFVDRLVTNLVDLNEGHAVTAFVGHGILANGSLDKIFAYACARDSVDVVDCLLEYKVDYKKKQLLSWAAKMQDRPDGSCCSRTRRMLLDRVMEPTVDTVVAATEEGKMQNVRLLLDRGVCSPRDVYERLSSFYAKHRLAVEYPELEEEIEQ